MCRSTDSAGVHVSSTDTTGDTESCSLYSRDLSKCLASTILCTDSIDYKLSSANNSSDSLIVPSSCVSKEKLNNPSAGDVSSTDLTVDLPLSTHRVSNNVLEMPHFPVTRSTSSSLKASSLEMISTVSLEVQHNTCNDQSVDLHLMILFNT